MKSLDNTFSFEKPEDSSGFLLWQVTNLWQREIRKALEIYDLTHAQFVIMANIHWLNLQQQEVTQVDISNNTKIDPMTTSTVLRTLQKKTFISRKEHPTDTRAKSVVLTENGKEIIKKAVVAVEKFDQLFFDVLKEKREIFNENLLQLLKQFGN